MQQPAAQGSPLWLTAVLRCCRLGVDLASESHLGDYRGPQSLDGPHYLASASGIVEIGEAEIVGIGAGAFAGVSLFAPSDLVGLPQQVLSFGPEPSRTHACLWFQGQNRVWQFLVPNVDPVARVPSVVWRRCEVSDEDASRLWLAHIDLPSELRAFRSVVLETTGIFEDIIDNTMAGTDLPSISFVTLAQAVPELSYRPVQTQQFLEAAVKILAAVELAADASMNSSSATRASMLRRVSDAHSDIQRACRRLISAELSSVVQERVNATAIQARSKTRHIPPARPRPTA